MRREKVISAAHFAPEEVIYVEVSLGCIKVTEDISLRVLRTLSRRHHNAVQSHTNLVIVPVEKHICR